MQWKENFIFGSEAVSGAIASANLVSLLSQLMLWVPKDEPLGTSTVCIMKGTNIMQKRRHDSFLNIEMVLDETWETKYVKSVEAPAIFIFDAGLESKFCIPHTCKELLREVNQPTKENGYQNKLRAAWLWFGTQAAKRQYLEILERHNGSALQRGRGLKYWYGQTHKFRAPRWEKTMKILGKWDQSRRPNWPIQEHLSGNFIRICSQM